MGQTEKTGEGVRAVERALDILLAFDAAGQQLSAGELLKRVDLSRPTLYRLLQTLEQKDFVTATGNPQKFALGPAVAQLARLWTTRPAIAEAAQPMMRRLWERTGETVSLLALQGRQRVCLAELPSPQPLSFKRGVGYTEDVAKGASGRAILAWLDDPTPFLGPEPAGPWLQALRAELARIRKAGYATSKDELIRGAVAVAVPYFGEGGQVLGSLAVFGPSVRMDRARTEEIARALQAEAAQLSQALGAA